MTARPIQPIQTLFLIVPVVLLLSFPACEIYEKIDEWPMSELDQNACDRLKDSLFVSLTTVITRDLDSLWVNAPDSVIVQRFDSLDTDTRIRVKYPGTNDTSYAFFANTGDDTTCVVYLNDYLYAAFIQKDSTIVMPDAENIPLETVVGCSDIKSRFIFSLTPGDYLLRLVLTESTMAVNVTGQQLYMVVLHNQ